MKNYSTITKLISLITDTTLSFNHTDGSHFIMVPKGYEYILHPLRGVAAFNLVKQRLMECKLFSKYKFSSSRGSGYMFVYTNTTKNTIVGSALMYDHHGITNNGQVRVYYTNYPTSNRNIEDITKQFNTIELLT